MTNGSAAIGGTPPNSHGRAAAAGLLPHPLIPRRRLAVVGQVAGGPEEAAGDQVEVARVFDGLVVVADGGGEDLGLAVVLVGPRDDVVFRALLAVPALADLLAPHERLGR